MYSTDTALNQTNYFSIAKNQLHKVKFEQATAWLTKSLQKLSQLDSWHKFLLWASSFFLAEQDFY